MGQHDGKQKFPGTLNSSMIDGPEGIAAQEYANSYGSPGFDDITRVYVTQRYEG